MKRLILYILVLCGSTLWAQDSLIISSHRFLDNELMACRYSKNQLLFLDSLISLTINERPPTKGNDQRFFKIQNEKLVIYHIDAGWICRLRGEYNQAHSYFKRGERYLDSLKSYDLFDDESKYAIEAYNNIQTQICYDTYQKDTSLFYAWDCAKFFPELNKEELTIDSIKVSDTTDTVSIPITPIASHFGKIYLNDTLRFNNRFVIDSISADFFNRTKQSILSKLSYKSFPEGMRLMNYDRTDTLIIEVKLYYDTNKISRVCSVVYSNCHDLIRHHYLALFSTMEFGLELSYGESPFLFREASLCFYIPIVIKPEVPNNYNSMDRVTIQNDHYLIEYEKMRPLDPK